jgi:hypothetical protein
MMADIMAKRGRKPAAGKPTPKSFPLRVPDGRLLDALAALADREDRSTNQQIVNILREYLTAHGMWPPEK